MADTVLTLTAPDISCDHCVAFVEKTLGNLVGVNTVKADSGTKIVTVNIDPAGVTETQIREALDEAGYPAS